VYLLRGREQQSRRPLLVGRGFRTNNRLLNTTPFDRHRGGGHPPTPATPPCVRVRTRRFESVTGWPEDLHLQAAEHAQHTTKPQKRRTLRVIIFGRATAMWRLRLRVATMPNCVSRIRLNTHWAIALPNQGGFLQTALSKVTRRSGLVSLREESRAGSLQIES
jgi:hypothetical protein